MPLSPTCRLTGLTGLVLSVVLTLTALTPIPGSQAAPATPRLTVTATTSPLYDTTATVKAAVRRGAPGQRVALQQRVGAAWKVVERARLPRAGAVKRVTFALRATWAGTRTYRVVLARAAGTRGITGKPVGVTVRPRTWLLSASAAGTSEGTSDVGGVSADGRWATFATSTDGLVPGDTDGAYDVFLADRDTGTVRLVSHPNPGIANDGYSRTPRISADGRYVVFSSSASLTASDGDGSFDIFRWSRATDTVELISQAGNVQSNGNAEFPDISADGSRIVYSSTSTTILGGTATLDVFLWDANQTLPTLISHGDAGVAGNGASTLPRISPDGEHVVFQTLATNLAQAQYPADANGKSDIMLWDATFGSATGLYRVSTRADGLTTANGDSVQAEVASGGRYVVFQSAASDLPGADDDTTDDVFRWDRDNPGDTRLISRAADPTLRNSYSFDPAMDATGTRVAFIGDFSALRGTAISSLYRALVWQETGDRISLESRTTGGTVGVGGSDAGGRLSDDGHWLLFASSAANLGAQTSDSDQQIYLRGPLP